MRPLITLSARWVAVACGVIAVIAVLGGMIRLLPWLLAREVPLRLSVPFARLLVARALEATVLVGLPVGTAIAAALFVERGEARALGALGARPGRLVVGLVLPGLVVVALSAALAARVDAEPPGRFASGLVDSGRAACAESAAPRRVDVPLLSLAWLCFRDGPRLAGALPGFAPGFWFTLRALSVTEDLRAVGFDDLHLAGSLSSLALRVHAARGSVVGLPAWGPSHRVKGVLRGLLVGASALAIALASAWAILRGALAAPLAAATGASAAALAALGAVRALDSAQAGAPVYALIPPGAALVGVAALLILERLRRSHVAGRGA